VDEPAGGGELPLDLALRIQQGDSAAEEILARHYARRVHALSLARLRDPDLAQELVQETIIAVILALRAGRLRQPEKLTGFVLSTARNQIANHFRSEGRKPPMEEATDAIAAPAMEDLLATAERHRTLHLALGRLDRIDQEILRLNLVEHVRPDQIALRTGLSPESVRQRKSRALRKLGLCLERFQSQPARRVYRLIEE